MLSVAAAPRAEVKSWLRYAVASAVKLKSPTTASTSGVMKKKILKYLNGWEVCFRHLAPPAPTQQSIKCEYANWCDHFFFFSRVPYSSPDNALNLWGLDSCDAYVTSYAFEVGRCSAREIEALSTWRHEVKKWRQLILRVFFLSHFYDWAMMYETTCSHDCIWFTSSLFIELLPSASLCVRWY